VEVSVETAAKICGMACEFTDLSDFVDELPNTPEDLTFYYDNKTKHIIFGMQHDLQDAHRLQRFENQVEPIIGEYMDKYNIENPLKYHLIDIYLYTE
jgi:hypothetical protein